jgi:hypothetical protein
LTQDAWRRALDRIACRSSAVALLSIGLLATGCYKYVPVEVATVNPQEDVRVLVTESAAARLSRDLGSYTTSLDGRLAREPNDSVSIAVTVTRAYRGRLMDSGRQTMFLGRGEVVEVHRRELSRTRTVAAGLGAVAVFALLVSSVVQMLDPNPSEDGTPPPPPEPFIGITGSFRIPIR